MEKKDLIDAEGIIKNRISIEYKDIVFFANSTNEETIYTFLVQFDRLKRPEVVEIALDHDMLPFFQKKEYVDLVIENMEKEIRNKIMERFKQ